MDKPTQVAPTVTDMHYLDDPVISLSAKGLATILLTHEEHKNGFGLEDVYALHPGPEVRLATVQLLEKGYLEKKDGHYYARKIKRAAILSPSDVAELQAAKEENPLGSGFRKKR